MTAVSCDYTVEGEGPAMFFIHGIGARRAGFAGIGRRLRANFKCVSYDLRGHGKSPASSEPFDLNDLVDDLDALRAKLGIEKAHFAGHSLGGMIGPAYARRFSDRVLSVTLLSTAAFRTDEDKAKLNALGSEMKQNGVAQVLDTMTARWFTDEFGAANPDVIERRKRQVLETDEGIFINAFDVYATTAMEPWLREIKAPALIITGEFDGGCNPRLNKKIAAAMPNSKLVILEGMKHAITLEAPNRVAAEMEKFLFDIKTAKQAAPAQAWKVR